MAAVEHVIGFPYPVSGAQLWICRYGDKLPAEPFYTGKILPAWAVMRAEFGEDRANEALQMSEFDWGTQSKLKGYGGNS